MGVLDLGHDERLRAAALRQLAREPARTLGVRVPCDVDIDPASLPASIGTVIVDADSELAKWADFDVLVQVTSLEEAQSAVARGASGLIAKGCEAGGRIGEQTAFVLLQTLKRETGVPIWVQGGVGLNTAAACVSGGAAGVVLDAQLALAHESSLPAEIRSIVSAMDGSETIVLRGHRVYSRPDLSIDAIARGDDALPLGIDLRAQLLPAGQDASFARPLAERFRTVGGIVRGIEAAIATQIAQAAEQDVLCAASPLAESLHTRYPIFQGPMTRVSDRAAFADAVASAGGLPFLALALMRGAEVDALLDETSQRLAGKTWGVGILGFVPPELREEQIAAVARVKPPVALIAGGRPAQARPLEELGIATFLHVPSPGLLDLFLKQGARKFVFEGSECGGHVGPRTSFVLWQLQIDRLLQHPAPDELSVVFAGGIHDALSAAMVATLAAPLAERGVKVGILMGTAYLFTREAVGCGAILPAFQQAAIECEHTVLLETAPGHATRCAETEYVRAFRAQREAYEREALPPKEIWERLEMLNLGRLRIAAKGLKREGDTIVAVDESAQRRDGMVMLGQVAALRHAVSSIAAIHAEVIEGASAHIAQLARQHAVESQTTGDDIAIIGMAAIMPGASDLEAFWANIVQGVNSIREVSPERWRAETFFDPKSINGEKTPSKWGGFLDAIAFDPLTYGIPPLSLAAIEPAQLLALEASRRALRDAGYLERNFDRENTAVIFGAEAGTDLAGAYGFRAMWRHYAGELPAELDAVLPRMTEDSFAGILGNVIAGRIANRLDLGGANYTVDAACASSLAAVELACKELVSRRSNMVLCGGVDLHNGIVDFLSFASVHALSPSGQCRPFDANADGIALGEGVAAVLLKRLVDAERDGDRIYAVIKAVGGASDGKSLGLTAPRAEGQVRTLARAYRYAGVTPSEVGLIEAHGTGTVVGDRTELETLNRFFGDAGAASGSILLGSVKSQIGHTKCAAGIAGLIKSALALHHRVLPPTLNVDKPNPAWSAASPFTFSPSARPWYASERKAGISGFGFGGTNFHAVLVEHTASHASVGVERWPAELFLLRGTDRAEALTRAEQLTALLDAGHSLKDLARSTCTGEAPVQIALVARDHEDLRAKLAIARTGSAKAGVFFAQPDEAAPGRIAFLFPGQGSQRVGMLADVFVAFPHLHQHLLLGRKWIDRMLAPTAWSDADKAAQRDAINDTRVAQPTLGIAELALAQLLDELGVRPDMLAGHSYGELAALCVAGAMAPDELLELSERRGERILAACAPHGDTGTMAAIGADAATVRGHIEGLRDVVVANENSPDQCVISGPVIGIAEASARLKHAGVSVRALDVACAFHSPLVREASVAFAYDLRQVAIAPPAATVYSNTTVAPYPRDPDAIRALLARHIGEPVRFTAQIEAMYAAGARTFIEVGPGRVLTGLVSRILNGKPHMAVALDRAGDNGIEQLLLALAQLAVRGVKFDVDRLSRDRNARMFDLAQAPAVAPSPTAWWVNGQRAWPIHGELPPHAMRPITEPVVRAPAAITAHPAPAGEKQAVVLEYMRNMRELIEAQRKVMLGYLGTPDVATPVTLEGVAIPASIVEAAPSAELPVSSASTAVAVSASSVPAQPTPQSLQEVLFAVVCERTGYPAEMLGLDLDLEADLSIDSIKRVEILGAVAERLGGRMSGTIQELPDDLVAVKTLRGIIDALAPRLAGATDASAGEASAAPAASAADVTAQDAHGDPPSDRAKAHEHAADVDRYVVEVEAVQRIEIPAALAVRHVSIVGAPPVIEGALIDKLNAAGSHAVPWTQDETAQERIDALVDLTPLRSDWKPEDVPMLFTRVRQALQSGTPRILVAGVVDAANDAEQLPRINGFLLPAAGGVSGMIKSLGKEWPDRSVRVATFHPELDAAQLARHLLAELDADGGAEIGYSHDGVRQRQRLVRSRLNGNGSAPTLALDSSSVIMLTGGARGITARVAIELGRRYRCRLELVGRTALPEATEDTDLRDAPDERAVRQKLIARGTFKTPAEIESACSRIMAAREIRATMQTLGQAGAQVVYHAVDVRDSDAFARVIDDIYARQGRLDGVIHGAGVIEDKLARDKTAESFARVFHTKVNGALTIAEKVRDDIGFIVFFSSIAATFGSRGQSDYAAANDFLDRLAVKLRGQLAARVVSINWGPWRHTGMVSPELEREYARRGIGLIEPGAGVASFIDELLHGPASDAHVILMRGDPSKLA
ncbi:MAG TPA: SDR family NAD(P)-dependent oxidoreductase [Casimicrobiaceae bacterium]|nr:SDR family NAD(P)-dependent oxidoreductase [Casimicrobiaceae bacterium]